VKKAVVTNRRIADAFHAVVTVDGGDRYCKSPCPECPWRKSNVGSFPSEAFKISADTAHDMARNSFACHMSGIEYPATCAGFLLSEGADDHFSVRIQRMNGKTLDVTGNPEELFSTYIKMAVANGVVEDDPSIAKCVPEHKWGRP
jgi:hypothetical protein